MKTILLIPLCFSFLAHTAQKNFSSLPDDMKIQIML